jgi:hypothetical protein
MRAPLAMRLRVRRTVPAVALASLLVCGYSGQPAAQDAGRDPIRRSRHPVKGQYLVKLHDQADADSVAIETSAVYNGRLRHVWRQAAQGFAVQLSEAAARTLARDPRVAMIEEDGVVSPAALQLDPPSWGLDRLDQRFLPLDGRYAYPTPAAAVNVYVVDSGLRTTHTEFGGRAFLAGDFVDDDGDGDPRDIANDDADPSMPDGADCYGHGTHVAGTIGGATAGVAKDAMLWSLRVFGCDGIGTWSAIIAAVEEITANGRRPAVVNLSLGGAPSDIADDAIRRSIAAGVSYVVSAGNGGDDASLFSPSRIVQALVVGATSLDDTRSGFSNWGTAVDLFAPGEAIASASIENDTDLTFASGTSAATAHAAGVAALYLGSHPGAPPSEVHAAIVTAAKRDRVGDAGPGPNRLLYSGFLVTVPRVSITSPARRVNWGRGSRQTIVWTHNLAPGTETRILISRDGGASYTVIADKVRNSSDTTGQFTWRVAGPRTTAAVVRVEAADGSVADTSDGVFTIADPYIRVRAPNGGGTWTAGQTVQVRWDDNLGPTEQVAIALSKSARPVFGKVLVPRTNADGAASLVVKLSWSTPHGRVRVSWLLDERVADQSDAPFRIRPH